MTPDQRVPMAREYLNGARRRRVTTLPPSILVRECAELRRQLGQVLNAIDDQADDDGTEPYCTTCGQWVGMFRGIDGWRHFRGDPAPGGQRELYEAGHQPVIGWIAPPARALSPGQVATVLDALDDAAEWREMRATSTCQACADSPAELCEDHAADLDRVDAYRALAGQLGSDR
ncbi:MAG TPA: hypothetical protein DHU96_28945 [Actinobacteria bacterium]|nr:hypothetical protein [Actinomycetota bacterium]